MQARRRHWIGGRDRGSHLRLRLQLGWGRPGAGARAGTPRLLPARPRPAASAHLGTEAWSPVGQEARVAAHANWPRAVGQAHREAAAGLPLRNRRGTRGSARLSLTPLVLPPSLSTSLCPRGTPPGSPRAKSRSAGAGGLRASPAEEGGQPGGGLGKAGLEEARACVFPVTMSISMSTSIVKVRGGGAKRALVRWGKLAPGSY